MDEYEKRFNEAAYPQQDPLQQKQDARQAYQEYQQQQAQAQAAQAAAGAGAAQTQGGTGQYTGGNYDNINAMYDAYQQSQLSALEQAYNQSRSNAQAARDELPGQYQARANDLATQYERNRRNLNQQAAANGLNTGAGSQMQLALGSNYQRDYGSLRTAEQKALNDADRQLRDMEASYQSSVQQAIADNDFQRAQALLSEYQNQYARQLQQAQTLASYGDFSAYLNLGYSQQQVDAMRNAWVAANPDLAYNTGAISAAQYKAMTGGWPAGYTSGSGPYAYNPNVQPVDLDGDGKISDAEREQAKLAAQGKDFDQLFYQLGTSRNPEEDMQAILNGPYYAMMTDEQKAKLAEAYRHAGGTWNPGSTNGPLASAILGGLSSASPFSRKRKYKNVAGLD